MWRDRLTFTNSLQEAGERLFLGTVGSGRSRWGKVDGWARRPQPIQIMNLSIFVCKETQFFKAILHELHEETLLETVLLP